jgi:hypothetical protein
LERRRKNWEGFICLLIHSDLNRVAVDHFSEERRWKRENGKQSGRKRDKKDRQKKKKGLTATSNRMKGRKKHG